MKLLRKGYSYKAQVSRDTDRRRDEDQTMARDKGTDKITDIQKKKHVTENWTWNSQQKPLGVGFKLV